MNKKQRTAQKEEEEIVKFCQYIIGNINSATDEDDKHQKHLWQIEDGATNYWIRYNQNTASNWYCVGIYEFMDNFD